MVGRTLEPRVGQVVEHNRRRLAEQASGRAVQFLLEPFLLGQKLVIAAVQPVEGHLALAAAEQLGQATAIEQPAAGLALASRFHHARGDERKSAILVSSFATVPPCARRRAQAPCALARRSSRARAADRPSPASRAGHATQPIRGPPMRAEPAGKFPA